MNQSDVSNHAAKLAAEAIQELEPLRAPKNVFIAFAMGFAFGPLGVGLYFRSAKDFFICLAMLVLFSVLLAFGPGEITGWLFSAGYGAWRAKTSNEKHRLAAASPALRVVDARLLDAAQEVPAGRVKSAELIG